MPHKLPARRTFGVRLLASTAVAPLVLGTALVTGSPAAAAETLSAPVLFYNFDDTSDGVVANLGTGGAALNGVIKDATSLDRGQGPTGDSGKSLKLPGASIGTKDSPYLQIPNGLFDQDKALTVSTWIKWDGQYGNQNPWAYIVGSDGLPGNNWGVYFQPSEGGQSAAVANTGTEVKAFNDTLPANKWTYITTTVDSQSISYYVNGILVKKEAGQFDLTKLASSASTFSGLIGRTQWTGDYAAYFPGEFDDFAVFDSALTADQVAQIFKAYTGEITSVDPQQFAVTTPVGRAPQLPSTTKVTYSGGSSVDLPITWDSVAADEYDTAGNKFTVQGTVPGWSKPLVANVSVEQRQTEDFVADFGQDTGAFKGGATGTLYGLGDETSPSQALVNGAAMTTISQKPPLGTQHPGGDALNVEDSFFAKWGRELGVYTQDYYPDWPYHANTRPGDDWTFKKDANGNPTGEKVAGGNGVWDYLEVLDSVADKIATGSDHPEKFVFIPFNEPDWIWYGLNSPRYSGYLVNGGQPDSFTPNGESDWKAAWDTITAAYARHGLARPMIAGPGDSIYMGEARITEFMKAAKASGTVPDVYVWHELGGYSWMPDRMASYKRAASAAGIADADIPPVNVTEYGSITDMSGPSSLLHWFSSFEAAKVDAQTAYWTASGVMSDNQALGNSANGGWWTFKWYGDMHGTDTVKVTTNQDNGIASLDKNNRRAQFLIGNVDAGKDAQVRLDNLTGLGDNVDIEVREARVSGVDGQQTTPPLVATADNAKVVNGSVSIRVPSSDSHSVYQVIVTPATDRDVTAEQAGQPASYSIEAENTALTDARVRTSPGDSYHASNDLDVVDFTQADSRSDWKVKVDKDGLYRLQVIGASTGVPAQHALFVDDKLSQRVQYGATGWKPGKVQSTARSSAEVYVQLSAGEHTLSLRTSEDGKTILPNAANEWGNGKGVSLDRYTLTRVGQTSNTEKVVYPATTFRVANGASLSWDGDHRGSAAIGANQRADLYPAVMESGYYDVNVAWHGPDSGKLELKVNGRTATTFGAGQSTVRVHLPEGVSEFELFGSDGVTVSQVTTTRATDGDKAIVRIEAEDASKVSLGGTAKVQTWGTQPTDGVGTNGSGAGYVTGLGITDANADNEGTMTIRRGSGFDKAGEYDVVVHYSNDNIQGTHDYNPQVVDTGLEAKEGNNTTNAGRSTFRYTYSKTNFFEAPLQLSLKTDGDAIRFGNTRHTLQIDNKGNQDASDDVALDGYALGPNVDWIEFAPFVLASEGTQSSVPAAPSVPTVRADGSSAVISWDAPEDGGSTITSYSIAVTRDGQTAPERTLKVTDNLSTRNSLTINDLAEGSYTVTVAATNGVGTSNPSPASAAFTITKTSQQVPVIGVSGELVPGGWVTVTGSRFPANAKGSVEVRSTPVKIADISTDAAGTFSARAQLPADLSVGNHTLVAMVAGAEASLSVTVASGATPNNTGGPTTAPSGGGNSQGVKSGALALTGAAAPLGLALLAAAAVGAGLIVRRRRRARDN
ncbi:hypothetical protein CH252_21190 [Rhodococcus sp. 06-1477-1B]|nr:hypothetical protein CH252_21190 [Rhodococcus sp. 06-1477-1B]